MKIRVPKYSLPGTVAFIVCLCFSSLTARSQTIDFGKSYINVTKGQNGGTVEPNDTLEIRASLVVSSGTYDSCSFSDIIPAGTTYVPGSIRVLTNEGKIYKQLTDARTDDQGWFAAGNVHINLGFGATSAATAFRRGRVVNTDKPSFYGSSCIMIASFRVVVNSAYNSSVSIGGGSMTYKVSGSRNNPSTFTFPGRTVAVYNNIGICPNAVGANSLGTESNGTFDSGILQNRGTSPNVPPGYTYATFGSNAPQDYYYGIANNTSVGTAYTTVNTWPIPDGTHRVFGVWDIIGDHTNAANPVLGNPPGDNSKNVKAGYMLVINAAYRIDSAFQQTISGLCPNTYYEISLWLRNICSRCGCDVNGKGASDPAYIPTGPNDSSGVHPNLSFNVDGIDYYTTGDLPYTGTWVKKGFTFKTGQNQNSFTLKVFNNAPGGGGNDWALDDISVATCSPNLAFTPDNNPKVCTGNVVELGAWIRSYFNNYTFYKWQKSTNNGLTYVDAGPVQTGVPQQNGSNWEYFTSYPQFIPIKADSGTKYRVVVASTAANITNSNCSFADVTSVLTLNVVNCGNILSTDFLSFTGKADNNKVQLKWTTGSEEKVQEYVVEKSVDGRNFSLAGTVKAYNNKAETNFYSWSEPITSGLTSFYRIRLVSPVQQKFSRIVKITTDNTTVDFLHVPNPFYNKLSAEINTSESKVINLQLVDNLGKVVRRQQHALLAGQNKVEIDQTEGLPKGLYTLQLQSGDVVVSKRVVKM
jgi:hypothetical protein